jgi:hypothetical protein
MIESNGTTNVLPDRSAMIDELDGSHGLRPPRGAMAQDPAIEVAARPFGLLREVHLWLVSLVLFAPALIPYLSHFAFQPPGRLPTGFIDYDLPSYLANAREHFDSGHFRFFFRNAYDPNLASPHIYFQPWTLVLGTVMHLTGIAPNHLFLIF